MCCQKRPCPFHSSHSDASSRDSHWSASAESVEGMIDERTGSGASYSRLLLVVIVVGRMMQVFEGGECVSSAELLWGAAAFVKRAFVMSQKWRPTSSSTWLTFKFKFNTKFSNSRVIDLAREAPPHHHAAQPRMANAASSPAIPIRALGCADASCNFAPLAMARRAVGPNDVLFEIKYCGVCHTDLHTAAGHLTALGLTHYPCVPGHELAGVVTAVGAAVTKFKVRGSRPHTLAAEHARCSRDVARAARPGSA